MVNRRAVFACLFPLKFDFKRCHGVGHTYFKHFKTKMHNLEYFSGSYHSNYYIVFWWVLSESVWYYRIF